MIQIQPIITFSLELAESLRSLASVLDIHHQPLSNDEVKEIILSDATQVFIARDMETSNVVGMITLVIYRIPYKKKGWLEDLVVDENYRGQGIASDLIKEALLSAKEKGVKSIDLTSRPSRESANTLYQKLGFIKRETNVYRFSFE